jgi:hypothetical protein
VRICDADGSWWDPGKWAQVSEVHRPAGVEPGLARIVISATSGAVIQDATSLLFDSDSPLRTIRHGDRVVILIVPGDGSKTMPCWTGRVTQLSHEQNGSGIVVTAKDDRQLLDEIRIVGRYIKDNTGNLVYQQGWPAHFNPNGRPNCIRYEDGDYFTWVFAPYPDYGLAADADVPDEPTESQAGYWTLARIMVYLREWYADGSLAADAGNTHWDWLTSQWPEEIEWPDGLCECLDQIATANFDSAVGQNLQPLGGARKGRDINLEGVSITEALAKIFIASGGWNLDLWNHAAESESDGEYEVKCALRLARSAYVGGDAAVDLPVAAGGDAVDTLAPGCVATRVALEESSEGLATAVAGAGGIHLCERRCVEGYGLQIEPAWTTAREDALLTYAGGQPDETGWLEGCNQFPEVLSYYRIIDTVDPLADTLLAGWSLADVNRPLWPQLLSFLGEALNERYKILIEVDYDGTWTPTIELTGLDIADNGIFMLPTLRLNPAYSQKGNWRWTGAAWEVVAGKLSITKNAIRATLVLPGDHRLTRSVALASHELGGDDFAGVDAAIASPHAARLNAGLKRLRYLDLGDLYSLHYRTGSWPVPESTVGAIAADDRDGIAAAGLRDDTTLLEAHLQRVLRDSSRLDLSGTRLIFDGQFVNAWRPGTQIKTLQPIGDSTKQPLEVRAVVTEISWYQDSQGYRTEMVLA